MYEVRGFPVGKVVRLRLTATVSAGEILFSLPQVDLWTETLASEEYDALAMLIAKGVTTEIETTEALPDSTDDSAPAREAEEEGERRTELADGKLLRVTRYYCFTV